jgi:uncharacterized protein YheU (UPF0270 family)
MEGVNPEFVWVPYTELSAELLRAVVESFVLREGTDYGEKELPLDEKVARMIAQLKRGEASIVFDPDSDSVTILPGRGPRATGDREPDG